MSCHYLWQRDTQENYRQLSTLAGLHISSDYCVCAALKAFLMPFAVLPPFPNPLLLPVRP